MLYLLKHKLLMQLDKVLIQLIKVELKEFQCLLHSDHGFMVPNNFKSLFFPPERYSRYRGWNQGSDLMKVAAGESDVANLRAISRGLPRFGASGKEPA